MSQRFASQNAPVSARTGSRLKSVLKAGIATNAARLSDMNQDVLVKILGMAVNDEDPCTRLKELWAAWCEVDKESSALCKNGRLYDEANKGLGWYGAYGTLEKVNASGKYGNYDYQGWFKFSCDILKKNLPREVIRDYDTTLAPLPQHPAHDVLMRQYLTQYLLQQITSLHNEAMDPPTAFDRNTNALILSASNQVKQISDAISINDNIENLIDRFNTLVTTVWKPYTQSMLNWHFAKGENDDEPQTEVYDWLMEVMIGLITYTKLKEHFKWIRPLFFQQTETAAEAYGSFDPIG
jgi:hypothetical protein